MNELTIKNELFPCRHISEVASGQEVGWISQGECALFAFATNPTL
jgi:hypothetical protein